jgi:hypothetical protein
LSSDQSNEYVQAITAVGEILQYYDSDKSIPVFGFGAKLPPNFDLVSHCFALNGNIFDPEVQGIENVLQVYRQALAKVGLHGPTMFSQIIKAVRLLATLKEVSQEQQTYHILLILTDGIINDMEATKQEIVEASYLPISVIVVGVGTEDFSLMADLDSDHALLRADNEGPEAARDIVQFVPFSKFKNRLHDLAREVLYEVPKQLLEHFESKGIHPNPSNSVVSLQTFQSTTQSPPPYIFKRRTIPTFTRPRGIPLLLEQTKLDFINTVCSLGYNPDNVREVVEAGLPAMDVQLAVTVLSLKKTRQSRVLRSALKKPDKKRVVRNVSIKEA